MSKRLDDALSTARDTQMCVVGENVLKEVPHVFRKQFGKTWKKALVIADPRTWKAAGQVVAEELKAESFLIEDEGLYAEMNFVDRVSAALAAHRDALPVAVGSGTINDLTKLASGRDKRPYMVVGTAASMDGYASYGASITCKGAKRTFPCPAPTAIVADLGVMAHAPAAMTASGYADLFAKIPAGADWMIADALGVEAINQRVWDTVQGGLHDALGDPAAICSGDSEAMRKFVEGLLLGGFAMQFMQSSRCASGAEHQFSHLWDMEHLTYKGESPSHGFKVGIGTYFISGIYEQLLAEPVEKLDIAKACAAWPNWPAAEAAARRLYVGAGPDFMELGMTETKAKYIGREALAKQLETFKEVWPGLKERLAAYLIPQKEVERRFRLIGAPVKPAEIGVSRERMKASVCRAQYIRRRYTVLDLAQRIGALDRWTDNLLDDGNA